MSRMRLDKCLGACGLGSRKELRALVRAGHVTVNGQRAQSESQPVDPEADDIQVDGLAIAYRRVIAVLLHKPAGVLSATADLRQQTVLDLLPEELRRRGVAPVGRLDKDTTGLLLLTDDGEAACKEIDRVADRGATILQGRGGYGGAPKDVVLCACSNKQLYEIEHAIQKMDPASFIIMLQSNEVHGEGFRQLELGKSENSESK